MQNLAIGSGNLTGTVDIATEAAKAVVAYGFRERDIESDLCLLLQTKSGIRAGAGKNWDALRRAYIPKDPERYFFEDTIQYRILKSEFVEK